ncbi:hypothetical protein C5167_000657 [Papaver somniferum]|uniref:Uncharacterized protein n=1 Tax=Papaver somniferum TaxID=3469 RepID=A0A4Y7KX47_PAPSO|nr:hypothetical protein C5167_000657 [Papaver somniferum]
MNFSDNNNSNCCFMARKYLNNFSPPSLKCFVYVEQVNLSKDKHLSTDLRPRQSVEGTKIGQKTTPHPVLCADNHNAVTESRAEVDNPAAHNTNCISEDIPNPLTQPTKVTGLLMPSPSLRFFDQPKSSASHSNQSVTAQLSNHRASKIILPSHQIILKTCEVVSHHKQNPVNLELVSERNHRNLIPNLRIIRIPKFHLSRDYGGQLKQTDEV